MSKAKQLDVMVKRNVFVTKIWNFLGAIIAVPLVVSAPIINLIADSLVIILYVPVKRWTEKHFGKLLSLQPKRTRKNAFKLAFHKERGNYRLF